MRIVVSGGGTGGHIYPALAMIREIERRMACEVLYIGTENGLEADIVRRAGIPFESIEISGLRRSLSFENVKTGFRFMKSVVRVRKLLRDFQPDIVVGTGGFVCGPVLIQQRRWGIRRWSMNKTAYLESPTNSWRVMSTGWHYPLKGPVIISGKTKGKRF